MPSIGQEGYSGSRSSQKRLPPPSLSGREGQRQRLFPKPREQGHSVDVAAMPGCLEGEPRRGAVCPETHGRGGACRGVHLATG